MRIVNAAPKGEPNFLFLFASQIRAYDGVAAYLAFRRGCLHPSPTCVSNYWAERK